MGFNSGRYSFIIKISVAVGLLVGVFFVGFFSSYVVKGKKGTVFVLMDKVGQKTAKFWAKATSSPKGKGKGQSVKERQYSSIFLPLKGKMVTLPKPDRPGGGGALASWGEDIVLLTQEGKIYFIDPKLTVTLSDIEVPDSGFDDYAQAAGQPPLNKLQHAFYWFRYNDILHFETAEEEGFLISFTRFDRENTCYNTTISKLLFDRPVSDKPAYKAAAADWTDIYQTSPCLPLKDKLRAIEGQMAGGRMVFDGEHTVYLTSGDYHWDGDHGPLTIPGTDPDTGPPVAQDPQSDYGKIISIDLPSGRVSHLSNGHRNPQGITLDDKKQLWVAEHGPRGGDELNLILAGENYGWPLESYGTLYSSLPMPGTLSYGRHDNFRKPRLAWLPSIAPSGMTLVKGFHEAWDGDLLVSTLNGRALVRLRIDGQHVVFSEFIDLGQRLRYVHQHGDGRLVVATERYEVIFLSPAPGGLGFQHVDNYLQRLDAGKEYKDRVYATVHACMECHSFTPGVHGNAPSLGRVFGSKVGSSSFKMYSPALAADGRVWDRELLMDYLASPQKTVQGTVMPKTYPSDKEVLREIVNILEELGTAIE